MIEIRGADITDDLCERACEWVESDPMDEEANRQVAIAAGECLRALPKHHRCEVVARELLCAFTMGMATMRELAREGKIGG